MYRFFAAILLATATALPAAAETKLDPEQLAKSVAPYLDDRTLIVAHIDVTRLDVKSLIEAAARLCGSEVRDFELIQKRLERFVPAFRKAGGTDLFIVFSLMDLDWDLIHLTPSPFFLVPAKGDSHALTASLEEIGPVEKLGEAIVIGKKATLDRLRKLKPAARPELAKAFAAAGDSAIQICLLPPDVLRRAVEEMLPQLPEDLGSGSTKELTRGCHWAALSLDVNPAIRLRLLLQTADGEAAKSLHSALTRLLKALGQHRQFREFLPNVELALPKPEGARLTMMRDEKELANLLQPLLAPLRPPPRSDATINLGKILLALHNHHDAYGRFPAAATYDKQGKPLLSWRVHILPFLGEDKLYNEFHLDEPWDSEHNKKLIARMPDVFRSSENAGLAKEGKTTFLAPLGDDTMFPDKRGVRVADVLDGTANTILLVDVEDARAVIWTRPEDWSYDPADPFKGLARRVRGRYIVGLANASVKVLKKEISKSTMQKLFTRADGNPLGPDF